MKTTELTEREKEAVERRMNPKNWQKRQPTYREIGEDMGGIGPERVRQLLTSAKAKGAEVE